MNHKLRVLLVDVLGKVVALAAGLTFFYCFLYVLPRFMEVRAGRTSFGEVKGYFGLGLSAVLVVGALFMLLLRLSRDVRREPRPLAPPRRIARQLRSILPLPRRCLPNPSLSTRRSIQSIRRTGLNSGNLCWTATDVAAATAAALKSCTFTTSCRSRAAAPTRWATCARCARVAMRGCTRTCRG